jgi:hypothetical protein
MNIRWKVSAVHFGIIDYIKKRNMATDKIQTTMTTRISDVRIIVERGLKKACSECQIIHGHTLSQFTLRNKQ